eukprot:GFUD01129658.1.p1 GENE.GFUD01129658.1~~GFUD01129658.1.p1  ORF type:complete len:149 (+),score=54.44 GFUD01129658.1:124-570(+)
MKSENLTVNAQTNILSALRQQLISTALDSKQLRHKANNLPVYRPVRKIDRKTFKGYYKNKIVKMMDDSLQPSDVQKLREELQSSLTAQLGSVQAKLEVKKSLEESAKKRLQEELRKSLKQQLWKVLPRYSEVSDRRKLHEEFGESLQQ